MLFSALPLLALSLLPSISAYPSALVLPTADPCAAPTTVDLDVERTISKVIATLPKFVDGLIQDVTGLVDGIVGGILPRDLAPRQTSSVKTINVNFWVIRANSTAVGGTLTSTQINNQINTLNTYYQKAGFKYVLSQTNYVTNADWFDNAGPGSQQQTDMKNSLRQGGAGTLNLYSVSFKSNAGLLGYATFPNSYASAPKDDGVVFNYGSITGGTINGYTQGITLVHEVGHWLLLYHTFQGGCSDTAGDYVSDTPAEASNSFTCDTSRDTCPNLAGNDPVTNFMDYTQDACKVNGGNGFTSGQISRMRAAAQQYRGL